MSSIVIDVSNVIIFGQNDIRNIEIRINFMEQDSVKQLFDIQILQSSHMYTNCELHNKIYTSLMIKIQQNMMSNMSTVVKVFR